MNVDDITAIILCGGSAARFRGGDKTLLSVRRRPLVAYTVERIAPQVGAVLLSCGRDVDTYASLGLPAIADRFPDQGPLGGIVSALPHVDTPWLIIHPGDVPNASSDLVARLSPPAESHGIATPVVDGHRQHLTVLMRRELATDLASYFEGGGRAIKHWLDQAHTAEVDLSDIASAFININTPQALAAFESILAQ